MSLTEADKKWIRSELVKGGGKRALTIIKEWTSPAVAVVFAIFFLTEWGNYVEFRTQTKDKLETIERKLTAADLQKLSVLPQAIFDKSLPELRSSLADARRQGLRVSPTVVNDLRERILAAGSATPDFWATTAEFVSYRSLAERQPAFAKPVGPNTTQGTPGTFTAAYHLLPDCVDSLPKPMKVKEVLSPTQLVQDRGVYENCRFVLDSQKQDETLNAILNASTPLLTFKNCLIEYYGGEIHLILAWDKVPFTWKLEGRGPADPDKTFNLILSGPSIQFEECVFRVSFQSPPPENGQRLTTVLLAENTKSLALPVAR